MPIIDKMNINNSLYNLAGGGGTSYIAGPGIAISDTGVISVVATGLSEGDIALIEFYINNNSEMYYMRQAIADGAARFAKWDSEKGSFVLRDEVWSSEGLWSSIRQTSSEITQTVGRKINDILDDSEFQGRIAASVVSQTADEFEITFGNLNELTETLSDVKRQFKFDEDGLRIAAGPITSEGSYTMITEDGMKIISDGVVVAEASGSRFRCNNGFGVDDWIIEKGTTASTLLFYREN